MGEMCEIIVRGTHCCIHKDVKESKSTHTQSERVWCSLRATTP